ncbi:hypothetical protein O6H91_06G005700 [Diphasiastrum complanatum]|uniref:Uncharacterized protein n=2 Tax=Diphasiastrum complanatum TaxID=34168 RepID=A0ACC2DAP4_DIPCM|nr:hypothetical protein O6H91_06G005700 [Diphasiastrum complanatum]KAJ7551230.1 hypothetical protein O6H91_06G005700 [Diphasiastrum complanatum]
MAGTPTSKYQPPKPRKRIDADLKRGTNGSAFTRCDDCQRDIPVALVDMHDCTNDALAKAKLLEIFKEAPAKKEVDLIKPKESDKRKTCQKDSKEKAKKVKSVKDPSMPKRPVTAFFLFMEDFRKTCRTEHPSVKGGAEINKLGGEKWTAMTTEEKSPYNKMAVDLKTKYESAIKDYHNTNCEKALQDQGRTKNETDLEEGGGETED